MASADSEDQPIEFSTPACEWHRSMLNSERGGAGGSCVSGLTSDGDVEARPSERLPQHPTGLPIAALHAAFLDSGPGRWQSFLIEDSRALRLLLVEQHRHELRAGASFESDFEEWLHTLQLECAPTNEGKYWPTFGLSRVEVLVRLRPVVLEGPSGEMLGVALHVARPADTPYFFSIDEVKGMAEQREPAAAATAGLFAAGGAVLVECTSHLEACALHFGNQALPGMIRGPAGPLKWFRPGAMGGWETFLWAHGASCAVGPGGCGVFYRWLKVRVGARGLRGWICFPVLAQAAVFSIVPAHPRSYFAERLPAGGRTGWLVFDAVLRVGRSLGLRVGGGPAPAAGTPPPAHGHRSVGLDARDEERDHPHFEAVAAAAASVVTASGGRLAGVSPEGASPSDAGQLAGPDGRSEGGDRDGVRIVGAGASGSEYGPPPSASAAPSAAGEAVVASEAPRAASREQGPRELMSEITRDYPRLSESRRSLPRRRWRPAWCSLPPCKAAAWEAVARRLWPRWSRDSS